MSMPKDRDAWQANWQRHRDAISDALLGALTDGQDVAELLVSAAVAAERAATRDSRSILDNRPGSWEASQLRDMLQSGGAYEEAW